MKQRIAEANRYLQKNRFFENSRAARAKQRVFFCPYQISASRQRCAIRETHHKCINMEDTLELIKAIPTELRETVRERLYKN